MAPSCNINLIAEDAPCNQNHVNAVQTVEIPAELQAKCIAKVKELRQKFPHMKPERIKRKVAEYFKIKLV